MIIFKSTVCFFIVAILLFSCSGIKQKQGKPSKVAESLLELALMQCEKDKVTDSEKYAAMYLQVQQFRQKVKQYAEGEGDFNKKRDSLKSAVTALYSCDTNLMALDLRTVNEFLADSMNEETFDSDIQIIEYIAITHFWNKMEYNRAIVDTMAPVLIQAANGSLVITCASFWKNFPPGVFIEKGNEQYDTIPYINGMAVLDSKYLAGKSFVKGFIKLRGNRGDYLYLPFTRYLARK